MKSQRVGVGKVVLDLIIFSVIAYALLVGGRVLAISNGDYVGRIAFLDAPIKWYADLKKWI